VANRFFTLGRRTTASNSSRRLPWRRHAMRGNDYRFVRDANELGALRHGEPSKVRAGVFAAGGRGNPESLIGREVGMSRARGWPSHLSVAAVHRADGTLLLRLRGEIDVVSGPPLGTAIMAAPAYAPGVVLDLADVTLVSAAGYRALAGAAAYLADDGRQLMLARCRVLAALRHLGVTGVARVFETVDAALAALAGGPVAGGTELARVRARASALPGLLQTRPVIKGAMALLRARYGCPDNESAFALLRESSQSHNIRIRTLAAALLTTRPPDPGSPVWFAGRRRSRPPPVTFRTPRREWRESRGAFLADVLDSALARMDTDRGDLALADLIVGGLRLELERGLPDVFTSAFAHVDAWAGGEAGRSARAEALRRGVRVAVADVTTSPVWTDPVARTALLAVEARAVQSTPLISADGHCHGMVSTVDSRAGRTPSAREAAELDVIGREAGSYLAWHQRTIVLDALEHLHQAARRAGW
jgi:anti-anti-sigma factor